MRDNSRSGIVRYLQICVTAAASGFALYFFYAERNPVALIVGLTLLVAASLLMRIGRRSG